MHDSTDPPRNEPEAPLMGESPDRSLDFLALFGSHLRRAIFEILLNSKQPMTISEIAVAAKQSASNISPEVTQLAKAGLVIKSREKKSRGSLTWVELNRALLTSHLLQLLEKIRIQ